MNFNIDAINSILTRKHGDVSSVKVLEWHVDDITEVACINCTTRVSRLIIHYRILGENNSAPIQEICFVKMPTEGFLYESAISMDLYNKEIVMYTTVLPQMYSIEKKYMTPRLCYFNDKMTLALKDLSQSGYKCADRIQKLDIEHCIYALQCLAKFHALSVKLEKTTSLPDSVKFNPYCNTGADKTLNSLLAKQIPIFIDSLPRNLKEMYPNFISHLNTLSAEKIINALNDSSSSKFNVLIHGDFSINNIMFKYDKYGLVRKAKLIDFQFTRWSSPASDLLYFFITCMKFEVYLRYFPLLMNVYFNALNKVLRQLDCPKYDMRSVLKEMDTLYPYALYVLSGILPCIICDPNIAADSKGFLENVYKQDHYREISVKWCEHLAKKGTLRIDEEYHSD
ncbi:uncharacterized protein LOC135831384 [Planococcus citri]|uniref:uncharacterized protein LOC135831384 n=1 Tax=Planococcus citri TaxID=170843 RepID=UPI0031F7637B